MIIGIDMDGVLADFNAGFIARVIRVTGRDLFPPRPFDIPTWNYPEHYGYTADEVSRVWDDIKADPCFWSRLAPYPDACQALSLLTTMRDEGDDIYFVTARPGIDAKGQTEDWLERFGFDHPTVLISSQKGLCCQALGLDKYLDDRWENVVDVADQSPTLPYMLARPWNRDRKLLIHGVIEVATVRQFLTHSQVHTLL